MSHYVSYKNLASMLGIGAGDTLLVSSDILRLICVARKNKEMFEPNGFIDSLLKTVGSAGTVLLPTFTWEFCRGKPFDYLRTPSEAGALSRVALKRKDFQRTKHPVYSFAVWGQGKAELCNLSNVSAFGADSPFAYLYSKCAKNLFIEIHHRVGGFPIVHYAEEMVGVKYRFLKDFTAPYIDENGKMSTPTYSVYVRNLEMTNGVTQTSPRLDEILMERHFYTSQIINGIYFGVIDVKGAVDIMTADLKRDGTLVYPTWSDSFARALKKEAI